MPLITFDSAALTVDGKTLLHPLTLTLTEHRIGIIGANGSGKSTLVRLINGLAHPSSGSVRVNDLDVARDGKKVRTTVGFVFSDADNQIIMPTVAEDVAFSLRRHKLPRQERDRRVHEILERMGLADHADQSPHQLSGGEKQMLALASIMVLDPELIIADEPTTLLDLRNRKKIAELFDRLPQQMIIVTHDLDLLRHADRVLCMHEGRVIDDSADPRFPSSSPAEVISAYIERM